MQCTRLETFRQSRVVVTGGAVVVVVAVAVTYSPVTANCARRLRGSTQGDDVGPMNLFIVHSGSTSRCSRHRGLRKSTCFGRCSASHGGNTPPDEGFVTAPGKLSACDGAPGKGAAGGSKSLLVRSRISLTNP